MSTPQTEQATARCRVEMLHYGRECGREVYDQEGKCICHSANSDKDAAAIQREIEAMLDRKDCDFTRFVFPEGVTFRHARFEGEAYFFAATFRGKADFAAATFRGKAHFYSARFQGVAFFDDATFHGVATFARATFQGKAGFVVATFQTWVDFDWARFQAEADFGAATFQGGAGFDSATFQGEVNFGAVTFEGEAYFRAATYQRGADFVAARFEGEVQFSGQGEARVFTPEADADFRYARFSQPENVVFQHVFLGRARLLNADVRRVDFTDVQWAGPPGGPCAVWDELAPEDEQKDYALIGKLYRQLKHNYEEQRDPITAGDFHVGEMQMRRLANPARNRFWRFLKRNLSFLAGYCWISRYGESYVRPLVWLGGVILLFTGLFALVPVLGLEAVSDSGTSKGVAGFWPAFLHSAMCLILRADRPFQPVHIAGHYISLIEGIIGAPIIAMFLLALNRRFRR